MTAWRLLKPETNDAFTNMAIDEAVVTARIEGMVPNTLRFYGWKPSAVSIGRFQNAFNEVHLQNCRSHGVDVVRRITGGGTVYHDFDSEITYSVILQDEDLGTQDVVVAYNTICNGIIEAAKILGVNANFNLGDRRNCPYIAIDKKKISGSAQFQKRGVLLQHGTLLLEVDLARMFTFLKVPWAKTITDVICIARERITSIKQELATRISAEEAYQALTAGFEKILSTKFEEEETLTAHERKLAEELRREKYISKEWNLKGRIKEKATSRL